MNVETRIHHIIVEMLGVRSDLVHNDSDLQADLGADSLDLVELIMAAEEEFGIEISNSEVENIHTVQECIDFIKSRGIGDEPAEPPSKFVIMFKTPDAVDRALEDVDFEHHDKIKNILNKFIKYNENVSIEFDIVKETATVLPVQ